MDVNGFISYAPVYGRNSAGVYCMYRILADIRDLGYEAFFTVEDGKVGPYGEVFGVRNISNADARRIAAENGFVAIYSEGVPGNPLGTENVMRWYLNRVKDETGQDRKYDDFERVYSYSEQYDEYIKNPIAGRLQLPTIDAGLFAYDPSVQKTDVTVYTGKQGYRPGFVDRFDNIIYRFAPSHEEVAAILKKTRTLYSFDCTTILVHEARLAGCNVVLIPDGTQRKDQVAANVLGDLGVSWYGDGAQIVDPAEVSKQVCGRYAVLLGDYRAQLKAMVRDMLTRKIERRLGII